MSSARVPYDMHWVMPPGALALTVSGRPDVEGLVVRSGAVGCRQPPIIEAVERKLAYQCADLDPGELPPTEAANRAWQQVLWRLPAYPADVPVPSISILGDGAACLEWGRGTRSAFLLIESNGTSRLRRLDVAEKDARMSDPIPDPQGHDLMDAIRWATGH